MSGCDQTLCYLTLTMLQKPPNPTNSDLMLHNQPDLTTVDLCRPTSAHTDQIRPDPT